MDRESKRSRRRDGDGASIAFAIVAWAPRPLAARPRSTRSMPWHEALKSALAWMSPRPLSNCVRSPGPSLSPRPPLHGTVATFGTTTRSALLGRCPHSAHQGRRCARRGSGRAGVCRIGKLGWHGALLVMAPGWPEDPFGHTGRTGTWVLILPSRSAVLLEPRHSFSASRVGRDRASMSLPRGRGYATACAGKRPRPLPGSHLHVGAP